MKILVTGGSGLVGNGIKVAISNMKDNEKENLELIYLSSKDCDLTDYDRTLELFKKHKPDCIIHLAAIVGGLFKNMNKKVLMFEGNLLMNFNVLKAAHEADIDKVISCLSTCIFPDKTTYPINETMLHNGPPHFSNDAYAYAKRMSEVHSTAYREQYGRNYICIIPTNIYGPHDNYHLHDAHVIPALIHKCYLAKQNNEKFLVKGTGKPLRQFIYSEDLGRLLIWTALNYNYKEDTSESPGNLILSVSESDEISIGYVAEQIAKNFDYIENMEFEKTSADGQFKKTADNSKLMDMIKTFQFISIEDGIKRTVEWFTKNYEKSRK